MKHNTKIYKTMIFRTIVFIMNALYQGEKRGEGVGGNSKSG